MSGNADGGGDHASLSKHYGSNAVRRSFRHFVVGKGVKFVATLAALLILARWLDTTEYGAYIALRGLVEVARVVTTIGISAVLFRYLPELRASGNNAAAYRLLRHGMLLRILAIVLAYALVLPFAGYLGITFNIADWTWLIPVALAVGAFEFIETTLSQSLESFMWQKQAQFSLAAGNLLKTLLYAALVFFDQLTLVHVIIAEGIGHALTLTMLTAGLWSQWRKDAEKAQGDTGWLRENLRRMLRFGAWAFGLNLSRGLYGPGPNRLLVANQLPIGDLAVFGFASNLAQFGRRMMPSKLAATMIRPLLVAKYSVSSDFAKISHMSNLVYRFNLSILVVPIGILLLAGEYLLNLATADKYGPAAMILAGFLVILIAEGMRQLLELVAQAVERNDLMALSNLVQSASFFIAIPLIPRFGIWAVLIGNLLGTIAANVILIRLLKRAGFHYRVEWPPVLRIIAYGLIAGGAGWSVGHLGQSPLSEAGFALSAFVLVYLVLYKLAPPFDREELRAIRSVTGRRGKRGSRAAAGPEDPQ